MAETLKLEVENVPLCVVKEPWRVEGDYGVVYILCRFQRWGGLTQVTWNRSFTEFPELLNDLLPGKKITVTGECMITAYLRGGRAQTWTEISACGIILQQALFDEIFEEECKIPVRPLQDKRKHKDQHHFLQCVATLKELDKIEKLFEQMHVSESNDQSNASSPAPKAKAKKKITKNIPAEVQARQDEES